MRQLGEVIRSFGASCRQYVNDTQLYLSFHLSVEDAIPPLEPCLDAMLGWMRDNRLRQEILRVGPPNVCGLDASPPLEVLLFP